MICYVVLEKNMLMDDVDARQWTLIKNNRSLNDSGNLKRYMFFRKIFRKNLFPFPYFTKHSTILLIKEFNMDTSIHRP